MSPTEGKVMSGNLFPRLQSSFVRKKRPVACIMNVYDRKFYDRKLRLSLERNYDRTIIILAMAS
jgi:hypothetical protein